MKALGTATLQFASIVKVRVYIGMVGEKFENRTILTKVLSVSDMQLWTVENQMYMLCVWPLTYELKVSFTQSISFFYCQGSPVSYIGVFWGGHQLSLFITVGSCCCLVDKSPFKSLLKEKKLNFILVSFLPQWI